VNDQQAAALLRTMSTRTRLAMLRMLLAEPQAVAMSLVAARLGLADGIASQNLLILSECGLLIRTCSGVNRFYAPNREMIQELMTFLQTLQGDSSASQ